MSSESEHLDESSELAQSPEAETSGRSSEYGAVLTRRWWEHIDIGEHPVDQSLIIRPTDNGAGGLDSTGSTILLHGIGNDARIFSPVIPALADLGGVVAPTLHPGLFSVAVDEGSVERDRVAADLVDWLLEVAPPPWRIVGHSMGGVMTGLLVRSRPDLVAGAVLLNAPLPGILRRIHTGDTWDRAGRALRFMRGLAAVTRFGRPSLPRRLRGAELAAVRVALRGFMHDPGGVNGRILVRTVLDSRTTDAGDFFALAELMPAWVAEPFDAAPVTILLGDVDPLITPDDVDLIADAYPGASVHVLANCGHFAHLEWPQTTVLAIHAALGPRDDS